MASSSGSLREPCPVEVTEREGEIDVDGRFTCAWGATRRPFIHPLRTPAGHVLTRNAPPDHPWHHALWFTIKFVDGDNFWEEFGDYGVLRYVAPPTVALDDGAVAISGDLDWIRPDRTTVALREHRTWTYRPMAADRYSLDLDTTLVPIADAVLDRTPFDVWGGYSSLTFRGRGDLVDTRMLTADGAVHDRILGVPSPWLDLTGTVDGATVGVAMFDHPANPRSPTPWYGSTHHDNYGEEWSNFVNAALLWDAPMPVAAGEPLRLRYRVLVHDGELPHGELGAAWTAWAEAG